MKYAAPLPVGEKEPGKRWLGNLTWGVASLLLTAMAGLAVWNLKPTVARATITLPLGQQSAGLDNGPSVTLSPDGTLRAHVARENDPNSFICVRWIGWKRSPSQARKGWSTSSPRPMASGWFFADGKLKKVSVSLI